MHPRRGAAEAPCGGFCTVVSLSPKLADDPCCRVFFFVCSLTILSNTRQHGREQVRGGLTTVRKPPQGASAAPRRGRSARWRNPNNNQPTNKKSPKPSEKKAKVCSKCQKGSYLEVVSMVARILKRLLYFPARTSPKYGPMYELSSYRPVKKSETRRLRNQE